jgi:hypothetical protein
MTGTGRRSVRNAPAMSLGDLLSLLLALAFWIFVVAALAERLRSGALIRDADGRLSVAASIAIIAAGLARTRRLKPPRLLPMAGACPVSSSFSWGCARCLG